MKYIYGVNVNLKKEFINFYEWNNNDNITNLKKVKSYRVDNNMYYDILKYDIEILDDEIKNDIVLFCNEFDILCLQFKDGKSIKRSKLLIDDEISILQIMFKEKCTKFNYKLNGKVKYNFHNRNEIEKIDKINIFLNNNKDNYEMIKYLCYEWFNKKIYNYSKLYDEVNNADSSKIDMLFETIKNIEINV